MASVPLLAESHERLLPFDLPEESLSQNSGMLPSQWIKRLWKRGQIKGIDLGDGQIQPASLDLRLGHANLQATTVGAVSVASGATT